ncbi:glycosyltransferase family 4 protein [Methylocaldum sp.]|uniref:glycosyltransferase family 4 protein n=1 Tax=Methylocaldum sp. TaxID=1969727 RepID=UPI002D427B5A|nr:glycosyltransferase family 4 protein [Methylocaldum sp.]HYE36646.1 glycosyltransferase family 4 protein [Methylocaldum sp.]
MRILFVAYAYKRDGKCESLSAYTLAQAIRNCGHTITVLTKHVPQGPEAISINTQFLNGQVFRGKLQLHYFEFIARAYLLARRMQGSYDLIHHISPIHFRLPNPLANLNVPFIWGPVGGSIEYPSGFETILKCEPFVQRLRRFDKMRLSWDPLMRNTLKRAARIVVTTNAARDVLPEQYRDKSIVIPEIIPRPLFEPATTTENYIFCSGRLVPYKAIDLLLHAYAQCQFERTKLWITGDGPERVRLEALIKELGLQQQVRLFGLVPRDENLRLMAGARFCVFPALNEAFGHVNVEAMMLGKPVIVTDWGGPSDIVQDNVTGFKVLGRNPEEHIGLLAQRMLRLLQDSTLCRIMGERARDQVLHKYSQETIGHRYDDLYRSLSIYPLCKSEEIDQFN